MVKPENYQRGKFWTLAKRIMNKIGEILSGVHNIELCLQGMGILGGGALAIWTSDNDVLTYIREEFEKEFAKIEGLSKLKRSGGEGVNKAVIGRFLPELSQDSFGKISKILKELKDFEIGKLNVTHFELVHYKHEFLDRVYEQSIILLS